MRTAAKSTLINRVNEESLKEAHRKQKTGKAVGIDGKTKEMYEEELEGNIGKILEGGSHGGNREKGKRPGDAAGQISPVLANVYLHYVLDQWYEITLKR